MQWRPVSLQHLALPSTSVGNCTPREADGEKWKGFCSGHIRRLVAVLSVHITDQELNPERWGTCAPFKVLFFLSSASIRNLVCIYHLWDPRSLHIGTTILKVPYSTVSSAPDLFILILQLKSDPDNSQHLLIIFYVWGSVPSIYMQYLI